MHLSFLNSTLERWKYTRNALRYLSRKKGWWKGGKTWKLRNADSSIEKKEPWHSRSAEKEVTLCFLGDKERPGQRMEDQNFTETAERGSKEHWELTDYPRCHMHVINTSGGTKREATETESALTGIWNIGQNQSVKWNWQFCPSLSTFAVDWRFLVQNFWCLWDSESCLRAESIYQSFCPTFLHIKGSGSCS